MIGIGWIVIFGFSVTGKVMELLYLSKLITYNEKMKYRNPKIYLNEISRY